MVSTASRPMQTTGATAPLRVITPEEHTLQTTQTDGMVRRQVVAAPGTWIGITHTPARCASGWHHHGEYETYIGVQSGTVRMEFGSDGQDSCEAKAGDFIHVPQGAVHREINPGDTENVLLIIRVGSGEPVFNVERPA